ncbi:MAG: tRNA lysidine(34) synthetase TilS [Candidatus Omnitrophota bacterium]|jgi:tRNA(Ile)-lysidine synthase
MTFPDKIKSTIKRYGMLRKGDRVLAGVSGGPDSIVLLHILCGLKEEYSLTIVMAHLDHKFRGEESAADRMFCEELAKKYNVDIAWEEIDVPKIAKEKGISAEEAARFERYDFFKRAAKERGIDKIAVGHTRDDQAETVLMRMMRGAGMKGLGGISPVKEMPGFTIIRPLMEVSRKEIEGFIAENGLKSRKDSSNDKTIFTRNKVRLELIPLLEKDFNPNIKEVLANMAENLQEENDFLDRYSRRKFKSVSKMKHGAIAIDIRKFKKLPGAVRKRLLRLGLEEVKGDTRRFTYQHWKELEELIYERPVNSIVDLPGGIIASKDRLNIILKTK